MASQNKGPLQTYRLNKVNTYLNAKPNDAYVIFTLATGQRRKEEFYYGSSFISQSARFCILPKNYSSAEIFDYQGKSRRYK
jgi:hypothetical protein